MKKDSEGKVVLSDDLVILSLLDDLLKKDIINFATYNKAVKEVKRNGTNN